VPPLTPLETVPNELRDLKLPLWRGLAVTLTAKTYSGEGWSIDLPRKLIEAEPMTERTAKRIEALWYLPVSERTNPIFFLFKFGGDLVERPQRIDEVLADHMFGSEVPAKHGSAPCPFLRQARGVQNPARVHWMRFETDAEAFDLVALSFRDPVYRRTYVLGCECPSGSASEKEAQHMLILGSRSLVLGRSSEMPWNGQYFTPPRSS
jgi:hypothetical protein